MRGRTSPVRFLFGTEALSVAGCGEERGGIPVSGVFLLDRGEQGGGGLVLPGVQEAKALGVAVGEVFLGQLPACVGEHPAGVGLA